jgi:hypothetical protein
MQSNAMVGNPTRRSSIELVAGDYILRTSVMPRAWVLPGILRRTCGHSMRTSPQVLRL